MSEETERRVPLPRWGRIARETFWIALNLGALLVILDDFVGVPGLDHGFFFAVRLVLALTWIAGGLVWAIAVYRRRQETAAPSA